MATRTQLRASYANRVQAGDRRVLNTPAPGAAAGGEVVTVISERANGARGVEAYVETSNSSRFHVLTSFLGTVNVALPVEAPAQLRASHAKTVDVRNLHQLTTEDLIGQWRLVAAKTRTEQRTRRMALIERLLRDRAEDGDAAAQQFFTTRAQR